MKYMHRVSSESRATGIFHPLSYFEPKRETTRSVIVHCAITFALKPLAEYSQLGLVLFNDIHIFDLTSTKAVVETIAYFFLLRHRTRSSALQLALQDYQSGLHLVTAIWVSYMMEVINLDDYHSFLWLPT